MALLDVSELMVDPDFVMNFTIIPRTPVVNEFGENVLTTGEPISAVGSIQAATGETLKRLPEGVQLSKFITVFTKVQIQADSAGNYVSQIVWKNKTYNIFQVLPWEDFGAGWFMIDCELGVISL